MPVEWLVRTQFSLKSVSGMRKIELGSSKGIQRGKKDYFLVTEIILNRSKNM